MTLCISNLCEKHISNKSDILTNISKIKNLEENVAGSYEETFTACNRKWKILQIWFVFFVYFLVHFCFLWYFGYLFFFIFSLLDHSFVLVLSFSIYLIYIFLCVPVFIFRCIFVHLFSVYKT